MNNLGEFPYNKPSMIPDINRPGPPTAIDISTPDYLLNVDSTHFDWEGIATYTLLYIVIYSYI